MLRFDRLLFDVAEMESLLGNFLIPILDRQLPTSAYGKTGIYHRKRKT